MRRLALLVAPRSEVSLPSTQPPVFPARCASCGRAATASLRLVGHEAGALLLTAGRPTPWLWQVLFGRRRAVRVPVCAVCQRWHAPRAPMQFAVVAATLLAVAIAPMLMPDFGFESRLGVLLFAALVASLPAELLRWLVDLWRPPFVRLELREDDAVYAFADAGYAREFAQTNGAAAAPQ